MTCSGLGLGSGIGPGNGPGKGLSGSGSGFGIVSSPSLSPPLVPISPNSFSLPSSEADPIESKAFGCEIRRSIIVESA